MINAEIKREELVKAIEEIALDTGITTKECIRQAIELLEKEEGLNNEKVETMEKAN